MMPNVVRGDRMRGLLGYLVGPGKRNEHSDPHLVAGAESIVTWFSDTELSMEDAGNLASMLDQTRTAFGVEISQGHVWHCSISLRAEEGRIPDEKWSEIANRFVDEMGFTSASGKAPCAWVAVHHGQSINGNDHIHLAVNLIREDGTKTFLRGDYKKAQDVCRKLEKEFGLEELESAAAGRSSRGFKEGELTTARRSGKDEPARFELARKVRAAASASESEAEFVRRARRMGVLVRPRYASGRTDVVMGYSAAARPPAGEKAVWYGGGQLAHDLALPRLRDGWPDRPESASAAVAEWNAAAKHKRPVAPGREMAEVSEEMWTNCHNDLQALRDQLKSVPLDDQGTWAVVAKETAAAFAAWSYRVEGDQPGPLAAVSDSLAKSAHLITRPAKPKRAGLASASGTVMLLLQASKGGHGTVSMAIMARQLANLAKVMHDTHKAQGELRRAHEIERSIRGQLQSVRAGLPPIPTMGQRVTAATIARENGAAPKSRPSQHSVAFQNEMRGVGSPLQGRPIPQRLNSDLDRAIAWATTNDPDRLVEYEEQYAQALRPVERDEANADLVKSWKTATNPVTPPRRPTFPRSNERPGNER